MTWSTSKPCMNQGKFTPYILFRRWHQQLPNLTLGSSSSSLTHIYQTVHTSIQSVTLRHQVMPNHMEQTPSLEGNSFSPSLENFAFYGNMKYIITLINGRNLSLSWVRIMKSTPSQPFSLTLNPLNAELNPICYLLALLGAHHFLYVSRIRVKLLTLRLLMSYIYIYDISSLRINTSAHCSGRKQVKG